MVRRRMLALLMQLPLILYTSGCPTAEQWFQIAAGLVPIAIQTVGALKFGSGTVSPAVVTQLTNWGNGVSTLFKDVAADIATAQTNQAVIPKIDAELTQIEQQANQLLPQFTGNTAVVTWIDSIVADAIDIANLVPIVQTATSGATPSVRVVKMKVAYPTAQSYQQLFQQRLAQVQSHPA